MNDNIGQGGYYPPKADFALSLYYQACELLILVASCADILFCHVAYPPQTFLPLMALGNISSSANKQKMACI